MSQGHTGWAVSKAAKKRNLLWTLPAVLFFVVGLGFLAIFAINYVDSLLQGGHFLLLIISSTASPFLTLGIFSLMLGGVFKLCAYLSSLTCLRLHEHTVFAPATTQAPETDAEPEPGPKPEPAQPAPSHANPPPEEPVRTTGPQPDDM